MSVFLAACSRSGSSYADRTINVEGDDAEMVAAIAKARESLPHFWQVFGHPERGENDFALKVKISDTYGDEHFWAIDIERQDGKITGTINNDPNIVRSVKFGDRIAIPEADISDWLYMREGKMVGNFTLRILFKQMPQKEVEAYKAIMTDP